jgi:outer membrane protein TolC
MRVYSFIFLLFLSDLIAAQVISLEECYTLAENHHPNSAQKSMIADIAKSQSKFLNRGYLPQLVLNGQASWQSQVTEVNLPFPNINIESPPKDQYKFSLDLNQTIWDGGVIEKQKKLAGSNKIAEEEKLSVDLWNVRKQVQLLYFGILLAEKQLKLSVTAKNELTLKRKKIQAAVENGIAIKSDLLRLDAKMLELDQQINELTSRKKALLEALSMLTGKSIDMNSTFENPEKTAINTENNRPELQLFDAQQNLLNDQMKIIAVKNNPKIVAFAQGAYARPGLNMFTNIFTPYFIGGVRFQVPLTHYYSGQNKLEIQQLQLQQQRLEKQKESFLLAADIQSNQIKKEIERLEEQIVNDKSILDIRIQLVKTAEEQWQSGISTMNDYLEELNQKELQENKLLLHEIQLIQAHQELKWTNGL